MVTFSTRDTPDELSKKLKIREPRWRNFDEEPNLVISNEEYDIEEQQSYICDTCGAMLEYNKIDDSLWCNTCIMYVQSKDAKKTVPFEIPVKQKDTTPLVSCGDTPTIEPKKVEPKGVFAELQRRGLRIVDYQEYNP